MVAVGGNVSLSMPALFEGAGELEGGVELEAMLETCSLMARMLAFLAFLTPHVKLCETSGRRASKWLCGLRRESAS